MFTPSLGGVAGVASWEEEGVEFLAFSCVFESLSRLCVVELLRVSSRLVLKFAMGGGG